MKNKTFHGQAYEYYDWPTLGNDIFALAQQILELGLEFDRLVALAKGGLAFSRSMVDFLAIPEVSTLQVEFYTGIAQTAKTPVITQSLPVSIKNERILVFDDIADQGATLDFTTKYLNYHGVKDIKTAVLLTKPWSSFKPDFSARESQAWVIFPNEARETIETLTAIWTKKGDSPEVVHQQLLDIGFSEPEVALFHSVK
jgi:hypothetical protein